MVTDIQIEVRNVYGKRVAYPVDAQAETLARIAGTKTLTAATMLLALQMGFTITVIGRNSATIRDLPGSQAAVLNLVD